MRTRLDRLMIAPLLILVATLVYGSPATAETAATRISGWTVFTPSSDTRIVYVSSSNGSDSKDGLSPSMAVKTVAKGLSLIRTGHPRLAPIQKGRTSGLTKKMGSGIKSGRSAQEPMVISSYDPAPPRGCRPDHRRRAGRSSRSSPKAKASSNLRTAQGGTISPWPGSRYMDTRTTRATRASTRRRVSPVPHSSTPFIGSLSRTASLTSPASSFRTAASAGRGDKRDLPQEYRCGQLESRSQRVFCGHVRI